MTVFQSMGAAEAPIFVAQGADPSPALSPAATAILRNQLSEASLKF
jgi:hypothetical protein